MNRKKYLVIIAVLLCAIALFPSLSINASENITYTAEQESIFDTVRELARNQALANLEQDIFGLDVELFEQLQDEEMIALRAEIARLRAVLAEQGAVPDDATLAALPLEKPFRVDGVRVRDLAQFRDVFDEQFELFAINHTVSTSYGNYDICKIMIQDRDGDAVLAAELAPNGDFAHEVFVLGTGKDKGVAGTGTGTSKSYRIFCDVFPTLHWIYVKKDTASQWKLALTTHSTAIAEHHNWYYVSTKNGTPQPLDDKKEHETTLQPVGYSTRLLDAITAYRMKEHRLTSTAQFTPTLDITATTGMTEWDGSDIFYSYAVDIPCPATPTDLAEIVKEIETTTRLSDFYHRFRIPIWLAAGIVLIPALWFSFSALERKIRKLDLK